MKPNFLFMAMVTETPLGLWLRHTDEVMIERQKISDRYLELTNGMRFSQASLQARAEWLEQYLKNCT